MTVRLTEPQEKYAEMTVSSSVTEDGYKLSQIDIPVDDAVIRLGISKKKLLKTAKNGMVRIGRIEDITGQNRLRLPDSTFA